MRFPIFLLSVLTIGCSDPQVISGKVRSVTGTPIPNATILVEATNVRVSTNASGIFSVEADEGQMRLMAGADGFIKDIVTVQMPEDPKAPMPTADFSLWPEPTEPGFFIADQDKLVHLKTAKVTAMASGLKELQGIKEIPETIIKSTDQPINFLFHSTLSSSEITQLDLKLYKLAFSESTTATGIMGVAIIETKMYLAEGQVKFELRALQSEDVYLITIPETLAEGYYAFGSQGVLKDSAEMGSLAKLPSEMQIVYPFRVK